MAANGLITDLYQLTMANALFKKGMHERRVVFDRFYRKNPFNGGYTVVAGLAHLQEFAKNFRFDAEDIAYLKSLGIFYPEFLDYLADFHFTGDIYAMPEGTVAFPGELLLRFHGTTTEAMLMETGLSMIMNHESLIATKTRRVRTVAGKDALMEFGLRRAQGHSAGLWGARAAMIGGFNGTSNVEAGKLFGIPVLGTMAHSWVQMFDSEYEAFKAYAQMYPNNAVLLVDTYNTLKSGVPNAIRAFNEVLKPLGITKCGIRFDSGDMAYLTRRARAMLDEAGWTECKITVSNSLDERLITELMLQGAKIDSFGVGERLITAKSDPVFGGVYKLCAVEGEDGTIIPKIKISENVGKITNPGFKKVYRFFEKENGMAEADYICLADENVDDTKPLEICDPEARWKRKTLENFTAQELLVPIFKHGELVYSLPSLDEIRRRCAYEVSTLWPEVKRFDFPHQYYVDLSEKLMELKDEMLKAKR